MLYSLEYDDRLITYREMIRTGDEVVKIYFKVLRRPKENHVSPQSRYAASSRCSSAEEHKYSDPKEGGCAFP